MLIKTLTEVVEKLEVLKIPYMLSGSVAMSFYTVSRSTFDINIVALIKESDIDNLEKAFEKDYFYKPTVIEEVRKEGMFNVIKNETGFKIDFIMVKNNTYSKQAFNNRKLLNDFGTPIYVVSQEDLIIAKIKWIQNMYSERQIIDIQNLLIGNNADVAYIKFWIKELNLNSFNLFSNE